MAEKLRVFVTRRLPDRVEAVLRARYDAVLSRDDRPLADEALRRSLQGCDVLVPTVTDRIEADLLAGAGGRLRLIANFGAGTDHIDLAAARARGIAVSNTPDVLTEDTADLVMALILMGPRRLSEGERVLRAGAWTGWAPTNLMGRSLAGKILGIVGMGRIGRAVAKRASAFGMRPVYHNRRRLPAADEAGAQYQPELDALLAAADVVSLNAPGGSATRRLLDRRRLRLMKADAWVVNAARGTLVDQEALIEALEAGWIGGAALDVYPDEPAVDPRLLALPNAVLVPHLGSATVETRTAMGERVIANIAALAEGRPLPDRVV